MLFFRDKETFKKVFTEKLQALYAKDIDEATDFEKYVTLGSMVRHQINKRWAQTNNQYTKKKTKQVYYLSMEFLPGRLLEASLIKLGVKEVCKEGLKELGINLSALVEQEEGPRVGNGGLGRLGACFMETAAALSLPVHGCSIRYRYGFFKQKIVDGYQVELPDDWLKEGNIWEVRKPDKAVEVRFGGTVRTENIGDRLVFIHENYEAVKAVPYDLPMLGFRNKTVNTLRLWSAEPEQEVFDYKAFSEGNYQKAIEYRSSVEAISQVLYPDDRHYENLLLRLKQQYFLVSASLQSIIKRYKLKNGSIDDIEEKIAIHINDTHPVVAIPELMRILMDEEGFRWSEAWRVTSSVISYTNHTTLPEALETWPVDMFRTLLPRIYMIVEEINQRFCRSLLKRYPNDVEKVKKMAIIEDNKVKMANLAVVGSHSVNGVSKVHTEILKRYVLRDFYEIYPQKFSNVTNGVTLRRFLLKANPKLAELITEAIGDSWIYHPEDLIKLREFVEDSAFCEKLEQIKQSNKVRLAKFIKDSVGIGVNVDSIFDIQVKRIHAYKRQLLNVLHILDLYNRIKLNPNLDVMPRTFIFSGKAAPGYHYAKQIIKLIYTVASIINNDPDIEDKIKVVFIPDYRIAYAEIIIPAGEVSEQISTASKEASGTGNMKFMVNGAITIGTLDGANIEIKDEVGLDNIFIFGLTVSEVQNYYSGGYKPFEEYQKNERLKTVIDQLVNGFVTPGSDPVTMGIMHECSLHSEFNDIHYDLLHNDEFFVLKDFDSYVKAQEKVDKTYRDRKKWLKMSAINIAHSGKFSSDRAVSEYAARIWKIASEKII
ncbi:glycogen/starch/alpha-glucan phosphorylase [Peptococcaceae bacterium]|nr:glycogen/starch/alpha-glucan phosphorylase [Peptococcaceae bacterium]